MSSPAPSSNSNSGLLLIRAGYVITLDEARPLVGPDAGVLIDADAGTIVAVDLYNDVVHQHHDNSRQLTHVDWSNKVMMPGLINAHTHFYSSFARGIAMTCAPPTCFVEILERLWWRLDAALDTRATVHYSALLGMLDALRCGVTTVFDHHSSPAHVEGSLDAIADAAAVTGVRACLAYEVSDRNGADNARAGIDENVRFLRRCADERKTTNPSSSSSLAGLFGLHASFTLSDDTLAACVTAEREFDAGFHVHVAEAQADVDHCRENHAGASLVERLQRSGVLPPSPSGAAAATTSTAGGSAPRAGVNVLAHCVHVTPRDVELLTELAATSSSSSLTSSTSTSSLTTTSPVVVAHQPESNLNNAVGVGDLHALLSARIPVVLGTDGFSQAMTHSIRNAYLLPKYVHRNPQLCYGEVIQLLQSNANIASRVLGADIGRIRAGAVADIISYVYDPPTPLTADNVLGHVMFGLLDVAVCDVITHGQWRVRRGVVVAEGVDEAAINARCRELSQQVWATFRTMEDKAAAVDAANDEV